MPKMLNSHPFPDSFFIFTTFCTGCKKSRFKFKMCSEPCFSCVKCEKIFYIKDIDCGVWIYDPAPSFEELIKKFKLY